MADMSEIVSGIEEKIYRLIAAHRLIAAENERLGKESGELKKKLEEQKTLNEELEKKLNILKTVKTLENKEGTVEAKAHINHLLREIDKCIGLLNV
jgi:predicted RNase H-like nuclease (RuvC/YqgF family)